MCSGGFIIILSCSPGIQQYCRKKGRQPLTLRPARHTAVVGTTAESRMMYLPVSFLPRLHGITFSVYFT